MRLLKIFNSKEISVHETVKTLAEYDLFTLYRR